MMVLLTHLLLLTFTILVRKRPNGCHIFLLTNEAFEGICLAIGGKCLQKEL